MKKLNLILGTTAAIVPATVLPLICAQTNNNKVESKKENTVKAVPNSTMVDQDGWVKVDSEGKVKYHVSFNDSTDPKTCVIDRLQANNGDTVVKWYPQATYTKWLQQEEYELSKLDTAKRCTGDGKIFLDLSKASNLRLICNDAFNHTNKSKVRITWVNFVGASRLYEIGERAFKDQYFDRDDPNKMFDMCGTDILTIGKEAFRGCCDSSSKYQNVWAIIFPESLMSIGPQAFDSLSGHANNLIADKIIFTGYGRDTSKLCQDNNAWPKVTEKGSQGKCVMTQPGMSGIYSSIYKGGGSSALGKAIVQENFYESKIQFQRDESTKYWMGFGKHGEAGQDDVRHWYPVDAGTTTKATNTKAWMLTDHPDQIWLESAGNDEYRVKWDASLPVGLYHFYIVSTQGEDENFSLTMSPHIYLNIVDAKLYGGSEIVRASYYVGQDNNIWNIQLDGYKKFGCEPVSAKIISSDTGIMNAFSIAPVKEGASRYQLKWKTNTIAAGLYNIKIAITVNLANGYPISITQNVTIYMSETYYGIRIFDANDTSADTFTINVDEQADTYQLKLYMYEGATTPGRSELAVPKLSVPDSIKDYVTLKEDDTGKYTITLKLRESGAQKLPIGSFQFYAYSTSTSTILTEKNKYPVYSNLFTVEVKSTSSDTPYSCTGGSTSLVAVNKKSGADTNTWTVNNDNVKIDNIKINKNSWSTIEDTRLGHITPEVDLTTKKSFVIEWDEIFSSMDKWYEIVDMNIEFDLVSTTNDATAHIILPLTVSIRNDGEIEPTGGDVIYAYSNSEYQIPEPWQMYCNGSTTPISTQVDYWIDEDALDPSLVGHVSMIPDSQNKGQAYLKYTNLPSGSYDVSVNAYDEENFTTSQRVVTIYAGNILQINNAPESITFKQGNGKYKQPLTTLFNGEAYTGKVTFTVDYVPEGSMYVDNDNCLHWTSSLTPGQYAPMITAYVESDDTVYSIPCEIQVVVEQPGVSDGVIAGAISCGALGTGSVAANIALSIKVYKSSNKVKPKSKKSKK